MNAAQFRNILVTLMNIDMDELVSAGVIAEGNFDNGGGSWRRFNDEPLIFVAKLDDTRLEALWKLVEARQPKADRDLLEQMVEAATVGADEIDQILQFYRPEGWHEDDLSDAKKGLATICAALAAYEAQK